MFLTCFQVPRPIGTGSGNVLVPEVHKSVALVIENVPVELTQCMHSEIDREWNKDVEEYCWDLWDFIEMLISDLIVRK